MFDSAFWILLMAPKISVIIPVYNGARFIRDALHSVCTQTYLPAEVVVADDASTDNTREVIAEFARTAPVPITLFSMEKNTGGPYGPAKQAFHHTTGDYICVLDADDKYVPEAFATYMAMFAADPKAKVGLATSDYLTFEDGTGTVMCPSYFSHYPHILKRVLDDASPTGLLLDPHEAIKIMCGAYVIIFKGMIARPAWEALGGPNLSYISVCDYEFVWRLVTQTDFRVRLVNRPLLNYRRTPGSMSSNEIVVSLEMTRLFRTMLTSVWNRPESRIEVRRQLDKELFDLAYVSFKRRAFRTFLRVAPALAVTRLRRAMWPDRRADA